MTFFLRFLILIFAWLLIFLIFKGLGDRVEERDRFLDFLLDFEFLFLPLFFQAGDQVPGSVWLDLVTSRIFAALSDG